MKNDPSLQPMPRGLKLASIYLIAAGLAGVLFVFLAPLQSSPEFAAQSLARQLGYYARELALDIAYVVSGVGSLLRREWARRLALFVIPFSAFFAGPALASGFGGWPPERNVLVASHAIVIAWNSFFFYQFLRRSSKLSMVRT